MAAVPLRHYAGVVLDLDGVCVTGKTAIPGAAEAVARMRAAGMTLLFATNNSTRTPERVAAMLTDAGIVAEPAEVLTSSEAAAAMLAPGTRCYVVGMEGLREPLAARGCVLTTDPFDAQACVVGMDTDLVFSALADAALAIGAGARFIGTNPDASFPTERGPVPGNGAVLAALHTTTGVEPEIAGKPHAAMFDTAAARLPDGPRLMVGDRLDTDIAGAAAQGWDTALVLSGVTTAEEAEASDVVPTYLAADLAALAADTGPPAAGGG
ncbi:MAG: HAD-IIA family hydrolase [Actinomycetota bacterium]